MLQKLDTALILLLLLCETALEFKLFLPFFQYSYFLFRV